MTEAKQEAIALILSIPDDKSAAVLKILENTCELLDIDSNRQERLLERVEEKLALMEEIENLVGEVSDVKEVN